MRQLFRYAVQSQRGAGGDRLNEMAEYRLGSGYSA